MREMETGLLTSPLENIFDFAPHGDDFRELGSAYAAKIGRDGGCISRNRNPPLRPAMAVFVAHEVLT